MEIMMYVTKQPLRSAALCQSGPGLCVDIHATHKWPLVGNSRSVDASAFDSVSIGSSLDGGDVIPHRLYISFLVITRTDQLLLSAHALRPSIIRKDIGASSMGREDIVLSPQSHDHDDETRLSTSSKAYFINSSGAILDLSRLLSLRTAEMKIVGTSPPNTSIFFPRHTGLPDVSELERYGST